MAPVKDDPFKPYKAIAGAVAAGLAAVVTQYGAQLPIWLVCVIVAVVAGIGAYIVPNPKKRL